MIDGIGKMVIDYLDEHYSKVGADEDEDVTFKPYEKNNDEIRYVFYDNITKKPVSRAVLIEIISVIFGDEYEDTTLLWMNEKCHSAIRGIYNEMNKCGLKMTMSGWDLIDDKGKVLDVEKYFISLKDKYDVVLCSKVYMIWYNDRVIIESEKMQNLH